MEAPGHETSEREHQKHILLVLIFDEITGHSFLIVEHRVCLRQNCTADTDLPCYIMGSS